MASKYASQQSDNDSTVIDRADENIRLLGYETGGGRDAVFWQNPREFSRPGGCHGHYLDHDFQHWAKGKRAFTRNEVLEGQWVKISDTGNSHFLKFHDDGTLTENALFDQSSTWQGEWKIVGPYLLVRIGDYKLHVVANRDSFIHSAVEFGPHGWLTYFKFIHSG